MCRLITVADRPSEPGSTSERGEDLVNVDNPSVILVESFCLRVVTVTILQSSLIILLALGPGSICSMLPRIHMTPLGDQADAILRFLHLLCHVTRRKHSTTNLSSMPVQAIFVVTHRVNYKEGKFIVKVRENEVTMCRKSLESKEVLTALTERYRG